MYPMGFAIYSIAPYTKLKARIHTIAISSGDRHILLLYRVFDYLQYLPAHI